MSKQHYVYHSYEEWGREYIGIRSCDCLPEDDTKYFGSFYDKTFFPTEKTILFVCETRKEAAEIEIKLHNFFDVAVNPQFANMAKATSTKFDVTGVILGPRTEAQKKAQSEKMSGEKHPMYGVPKTEAQKKAQSEKMSGENNSRFGVSHTEEAKKKMSEAQSGEKNHNYGLFGAAHNSSKAIIAIQPDGTQLHFVSCTEAARDLKMRQGNLSTYARIGHILTQGPRKGWQFIYKNSLVYSKTG